MMMASIEQPYDFTKMEKWLEHYFLDPLTTYYDQTQFRIDLYETENKWIVEALLNDYESSEITVYVENKKLIICGQKNSASELAEPYRSRTIDFPFLITPQKITASFQNGILEVLISKEEKDMRTNRDITLH